MTKTASAAARGMTANRQGASRALLKLKAVQRAAVETEGQEPLEALFPAQPGEEAGQGEGAAVATVDIKESSAPADEPAPAAQDHPSAPQPAAADEVPPAVPVPAEPPATPAAWSDADEALFQSLSARRKAAGFQRRGRDVSGQLLKVGAVQPNANTVTATIVALVAERGQVERGALLDAMATAAFPHPKAKPADRAWSQGWVAGALRDGFLATVDAASEASR
ncbi:hypothetical protein M9978_22720 [Sphingomonas sp. MG17]|uniref:Uncharacterized protein n=1 Tax=Sphingomonas tagetis TaxID=2949092 RepID=A0A9X2HP76_9SPHN|nr:hypothetical protein [Sphingomonas tagetis]MCP3733222.1 hypothetical protein [Sphingomonas tagetis]